MQPIEIKTSLVHIPLNKDGVNVGEVSFNPKDNLFFEKFYAMLGEFETKKIEYEERAKALDLDVNKDENGIPTNIKTGIAFRREVCEYFMSKIDELFGDGVSKMAFGNTLEPEVIAQFFDGITPVFSEVRQEKVKKYIKK